MPVFFCYSIFHAIYAATAYVVLHWFSYKLYYYLFWSVTPLLHILEFVMVYELFGALFRQREGLKDFGTMLFRWAMLVMLLMALVLTASASGLKAPQFMKIVLSMESSIQLIMVGLVLFLLAFAGHLGITYRHKVFGIILGWGVASAVDLLLYTEHGRIGLSDQAMNFLRMGSFDAVLVIWLCYAVMPEPVEVLPNMLLRSQRWNEALLDNPQVEGEPTLLLGIENLVDRALTANNIGPDPQITK